MGVIKEYPKKVNPFDKIESSEWNKIVDALIDLDNYVQNLQPIDLEQFKQQIINEIKEYLNTEYWTRIVNYINEKFNFVFDFGRVLNISTSSRGYFTYNVSFNKTFPRIPIILLTPENMDSDVNIKPLWASNVTTTGFILNVFVTMPVRDSYLNVVWFAFSYV